ncbi:hypothetical protein NHG33_06655 [Aerococcaceae bacterium NML130460]|nr:hypothetical protein [Aerococcaceae bacterium NML130460]
MDGIDRLKNAIVEQAAKDYLEALKALKLRDQVDERWELRREGIVSAHWQMKKSCERFFRSDWYAFLCSMPGEEMIQKLREKVQRETK